MSKYVLLMFTTSVFCWSYLLIWLCKPGDSGFSPARQNTIEEYAWSKGESRSVFELSGITNSSCSQLLTDANAVNVTQDVCFTESGKDTTHHRISFYDDKGDTRKYRWQRSSDKVNWRPYDSAYENNNTSAQLVAKAYK